MHTSWVAKDGAPPYINALAQTADGYLWLGTLNGLFRFDGVRFERYQPIAGPQISAGSEIRSLLATPEGGLWIGSAGKVGFLKDGVLTSYGVVTGSTTHPVLSIARDRQGTMWAAGARVGLFRLEGAHWKKIGPEQNFAGAPDSLFVDHEGTLWVGNNDSVRFLPAGEHQFHQVHQAADNVNFVTSMDESRDGTMWMANSGDAVKTIAMPSDSKAARPRIEVRSGAILFDNQGSLWVTSLADGLRRIPYPERLNGMKIGRFGDAAEIFTQKQGLSGDAIKCILQDREGNVWTGTTAGLDRFRQSTIVPIVFPPGSERVALQAKEHGTIQVASMNRPLMLIEDGIAKEIPGDLVAMHGIRLPEGFAVATSYIPNPRKNGTNFETPKVSGTYEHPTVIRKGKIIIFPEFYCFGVNSLLDYKTARAEPLSAAVKDRAGRWWFSVQDKGTFRSTDKGWTSLEILGGPRGQASSSFMDTSGRIWFGFRNSVARLDGDKVQTFTDKDGVPQGAVIAIHGKGASIWIAVGDHDLAFFDGVRFRPVQAAIKNGIAGLRSLLVTADESLWLGAYSGIYLIPGSEVQSAYKNNGHRLQFRKFGLQDGLSSDIQTKLLQNSAIGTDGRVYFATTEGVVWADPKRISHNDLPPPVVGHSLTANGKTYYFPSPVKLPPRTTSVAIHYTAPSLSIPERVRFRYKLERVDEDWQDVDTRRDAYYSNLGPGSYVFRVIACNEDGVWNQTGATERFLIEPAYYQTWWSRLIYIVFGMGVLWSFYLYRLNRATAQIQERLGARMEERERIARELHDTLLQGFQGLMLRFQAVMKTLPSDAPAHQMMEQVLDRADEVLLEGRQSVRDLREEGTTGTELSDALARCGEELALSHTSLFKLSVVGDPRSLEPVVFKESYRIAREALINAFQHSQAKGIEAEITYSESGLSIRVRDDGMGMDEGILSKGRAGHWGLSGMRERAQKMGAQVNIWSSSGAGTEVELNVPAKVAYPAHKAPTLWQRVKGAVNKTEEARP